MLLGDILTWEAFQVVAPYAGVAIASLLVFKLAKPIANGAGKLMTSLASATPMTLLVLALFGGPVGASILSQEHMYGKHGEYAALLPAAAVAIYSIITQMRRWMGVTVPDLADVKRAIAYLDESLQSENANIAAIEKLVRSARECLDKAGP